MLPVLVLASRSPHRARVLERLGAPFETRDSQVDETPIPGEGPTQRAQRLALAKARAVAASWAGPTPALVIGGDQVAHDGQHLLHKPGTLAKARNQLLASRGQWITFESAVAVVHSGTGALAQGAAAVRVRFAELSEAELDGYLAAEQPLDAAGALYSERLGAVLLEAWEGADPSALIGLPLNLLHRLTSELGYPLLTTSWASPSPAPGGP
ncbi:MAG: Maf family protein [Pseudomonadales bacterium]|nr:Maf family protein [Pseudomonadales bacterium]